MTDRTCRGCGVNISHLHGNARYCTECHPNIQVPTEKPACSKCGTRPAEIRGMCATCHRYELRHGLPLLNLGPEERFWAMVNKEGPVPAACPELGPCWLWTGKLDRKGYGRFDAGHGTDVRHLAAHRYAYELEVGEIPDTGWLRHLCDVPRCVNPGHLKVIIPDVEAAEERVARRRILPTIPGETTADPLNLAYWGGIMDGEGHLGIRPNNNAANYITVVSLRMTNEDLVEDFATDFAMATFGRVYDNELSVLPLYETTISGRGAARVAEMLLPYLRIKRKQAEFIIKLEAEKRQPGLRTRLTSVTERQMKDGRTIIRKTYSTGAEHLDRWHEYYLEVRRLNKPGRNFDIPAPARPSLAVVD
jgi:HNH endonuclease